MDIRADKSKDPDESWVWSRFKLEWPWRCQRQDPNGGHNSGIPDVHLLDAKGNRGLVELKRPRKVELRPSQWIWHEEDQEGGGLSCVVTCEGTNRNPLWSVFRIVVHSRTLVLYGRAGVRSEDMVKYVLQILALQRKG